MSLGTLVSGDKSQVWQEMPLQPSGQTQVTHLSLVLRTPGSTTNATTRCSPTVDTS